VHAKSLGHDIMLHTTLTEALKKEGLAREFMRYIQDSRKQSGLMPKDRITVVVATDTYGEEAITEYKKDIIETIGATELVFGEVASEANILEGHPFGVILTKVV
jgi:isoleucyl-tRNA synthetase